MVKMWQLELSYIALDNSLTFSFHVKRTLTIQSSNSTPRVFYTRQIKMYV